MNLDEIEEIRKATNILAEKLTPYPASIMKTQFRHFHDEVEKELELIIIQAYKNGELVKKVLEANNP
jgi:hypothetical protein